MHVNVKIIYSNEKALDKINWNVEGNLFVSPCTILINNERIQLI